MAYRAYTEWWRPGADRIPDHVQVPVAAETAAGGDSATAFWALMAFTFILLIAPQQIFPALAPLRIALLAAALAVSGHVLGRMARRQPVMAFPAEMRIVLCLVAWAIATVPLSYWPGGSVSFLLDVYFKTLIVFWLLCNVVSTLPRLKRVAWGLVLMAVPLAITGVKHFLSGAYLADASAPGQGRIIGYEAPLTENPNDLALMLNLILPLCVALFLGSQGRAVRAFLMSLIVLTVVAIIATFSRAGFLTLAVTLVTYLWSLRNRPERGLAIAALVISLAAVPFLPSSYVDRLSTITNIEADPTGSAQTRWSDTVAAVKFSLAHPLVGAGVGQNILAMNETRGATWTEIHNVYLQYAVELGLPGLILFLMLLAACIKSARYVELRCEGQAARRELFHLAEGIRISLVAFAVAAPFHPVGYHFYFYYFAGLAVAVKAVYAARTGGFGAPPFSGPMPAGKAA